MTDWHVNRRPTLKSSPAKAARTGFISYWPAKRSPVSRPFTTNAIRSSVSSRCASRYRELATYWTRTTRRPSRFAWGRRSSTIRQASPVSTAWSSFPTQPRIPIYSRDFVTTGGDDATRRLPLRRCSPDTPSSTCPKIPAIGISPLRTGNPPRWWVAPSMWTSPRYPSPWTRSRGRNFAVVGTDPTGADVLHAAVVSLGRQYEPTKARFVLAPLVAPATEAARQAAVGLQEAGHRAEWLTAAELADGVNDLAERSDVTTPSFLVVFGGDAASPIWGPAGQKAFQQLLRHGPAKGVHVLGWWRGMRRFIDDIGGNAAREDVAGLMLLNVTGIEVATFIGDASLTYQPRPNRALVVDRTRPLDPAVCSVPPFRSRQRGRSVTQAADYDELLYGLERVRAGDIETGNAARRRFDEDRAAVNEVVATAESIHAELTAGASTLRAGVPDLRGPVDPAQAAPVDLAAELTAAKDALAQAERHRKAAMKAAQLPPFLPRAPAWVRNLLVYVTAMVPAVFAQVVLTRLTENGQLSESMTTWFIVMPPVVVSRRRIRGHRGGGDTPASP